MLNGLAGGSGRYHVQQSTANATVAATVSSWAWGSLAESPAVWGWDMPLVALAQVRLHWSAAAVVDTLLMPVNKNVYGQSGVNWGMGTHTAYLPGNGGLLLAVAAMAAGMDKGAPGAGLLAQGAGSCGSSPGQPLGFPEAWQAQAEGFGVPLL